MGSGNSSPIGRANSVETEAHQDVLEIRFDHLAFGGTTVIAIVILLAIYWACRRKRQRMKQKARDIAARRNLEEQSPSPERRSRRRRRSRERSHTPSPRSHRDHNRYPPCYPPMICPWNTWHPPPNWQPPPHWQPQPWTTDQYYNHDEYEQSDRFTELPRRTAPEPPKPNRAGDRRQPPTRPPAIAVLPSPANTRRAEQET